MTRTSETRARLDHDGRWLRRARRHFAGQLRRWAEQQVDPADYRDRVYAIGRAMVMHGLLGPTSDNQAAWSVLSAWRAADGMPWAWRLADERRRVAGMRATEFRRWKQTREAVA